MDVPRVWMRGGVVERATRRACVRVYVFFVIKLRRGIPFLTDFYSSGFPPNSSSVFQPPSSSSSSSCTLALYSFSCPYICLVFLLHCHFFLRSFDLLIHLSFLKLRPLIYLFLSFLLLQHFLFFSLHSLRSSTSVIPFFYFFFLSFSLFCFRSVSSFISFYAPST